MIVMTRKEAVITLVILFWTGVFTGYTIGLIQQAIWKTQTMEKEKCEVRQQHF